MEILKKDIVAINRYNGFVMPEGSDSEDETVKVPYEDLVSLQKEALEYGYAFSDSALNQLKTLDEATFVEFSQYILSAMEQISGVNRPGLTPFHAGFPQSVRDSSDFELYFHAFVHAIGISYGIHYVPKEQDLAQIREIETRLQEAQVINAINEKTINLAISLSNQPISMSVEDALDMAALVGVEVDEFITSVEKNSSNMNRENLIHSLAFIEKMVSRDEFNDIFGIVIKTPTDIVRWLAMLSGGEISLKDVSQIRFKSIPRSLRRTIMRTLNQKTSARDLQDLSRYSKVWKRLVRVLHHGEYKDTYPFAFEGLQMVVDDTLPPTFAAKFDAHVAHFKSIDAPTLTYVDVLCSVVMEVPGEFARRLNHLLTLVKTKENQKRVIQNFADVADKVSTTIMWQMLPLFENRNLDESRYIYPKGNVTRSQIVPMPSKAYSNKMADRVTDVIVESLMSRYGQLSSLGNVWVNPDLVNYAIPTGLRSASKAPNAISRGSRVPFSGVGTERFYVWWTESKDTGRLDVDLSAILYDEKFNVMDSVSYQRLRSELGVVHSGDFMQAPNGAAEYIDIDLERLLDRGVRYIAMAVQVYSGKSFANFECSAGLMDRTNPNAGKTFDIRTVERNFEISVDETSLIPMVLDLARKEIVWGDVASGTSNGLINVSSKQDAFSKISESIVNKRYANLYQLLTFHAMARGVMVDTRSEADTVWDVERGVPTAIFGTELTVDSIVANLIPGPDEK